MPSAAKTAWDILCNLPYSGTEVIKDYGDEHIRTGKPIVYTSADSVFQIACHESIYPLEKLYAMCRSARSILTGENAVGRVIARPFAGESGNYYRTGGRHDYSLEPTGLTMLDKLKQNGFDVISVGKINDIFAGRGITESHPTKGNAEGEALLLRLDLAGIAASSGSACTSGSLDPSHVLLAIGLPHEIAHGSLRLSLGDFNTEHDVDVVLEKLPQIVSTLREMSPLFNQEEGGVQLV